ncbi:PHB depolymerase family esterase [Podospora fimiseda]|uniref:Carboxylic ester hydrolase n=1 Tax=Podospora fimiseda TaxID=252190 RepID=A0AAN7BS89_9PEZI|nr:PHB depolymerase family esterase [Podospora fimiseda]
MVDFKSLFIAALAAARTAEAQYTLTPITNWGDNPSNLVLDVFVPETLGPNPAIILALHWCSGTGPLYSQSTRYNSLAAAHNYVVLYPSSPKDNNCWDVATNQSLTRDGGGDSTGLANMVKWAIDEYSADPAKVFVTGTSSGCMMSNIMTATYPDLFAAVSCYSGVAAGCLAGSPGSSPQTADPACAAGEIIKTGDEWAAQARAMIPGGYNGKYPRFQTWHGDADFFVNYPNFAEQLKQWSTILGVEFTKNVTRSPGCGYTKMVYGDGTKLLGYSARGVGHVVPTHEEVDLEWFGI